MSQIQKTDSNKSIVAMKIPNFSEIAIITESEEQKFHLSVNRHDTE
jgi:hypothetical protein